MVSEIITFYIILLLNSDKMTTLKLNIEQYNNSFLLKPF